MKKVIKVGIASAASAAALAGGLVLGAAIGVAADAETSWDC